MSLYLPTMTTDAVYMEATNPDGSRKWWIGAYAHDGNRSDITFTCWGDHANCPDVIAQGKTIARGGAAHSQYRQKLQEKDEKGYETIATFIYGKGWSGKARVFPYPEPAKLEFPGTLKGNLSLSSAAGSTDHANRLQLELFQTLRGFRLDHREWNGPHFARPTFPDWQTLYPDPASALAAIAAVRDGRLNRGLAVRQDNIPWDIGDVLSVLSEQDWVIGNSGLQWDF